MNRFEKWLKALVAAVITGSANAGLASLGIAGANAVGMKIPLLDMKQIGMICFSGGFVGALAYLKQSPVWPDSNGDTKMFVKKQNETKT